MAPRKRAVSRTEAGRKATAGISATGNLNEVAYRTIKDDIVSCALQPGEEISEATLVERYGFSKAPIRSALMRLRQDGLVVSRGRMGNIVSLITLRDVQEIFQLRLILELSAVRLAAGKVDAQRLHALNKAVHAAHTPGAETTEADYLHANREFHCYVAKASGNQRLAALVMTLMEQHERIVHLGLSMQKREHEFLHFHDELVTALIAGDGDRAAELTEQALRGGQKKVMEALLATANRIPVAGIDLNTD